MKYLIVFISLVLFSETIQAQYKQVEVIMEDGSKREGFAEIPSGNSNVHFKAEKSGRIQIIEPKGVRTLIFKTGEEMEYLHCKYGTDESIVQKQLITISRWGWVKVISRGAINICKGRVLNSSSSIYCCREGEKHALQIPDKGFASIMAKYFEDYPELSKKISDEADGYKIGDISEIVAEYNAWRASR